MLSIRGRSRPKLRIRGDEVPTVDVFITCCGEDVDVVLDTTRAAAAVDVSSPVQSRKMPRTNIPPFNSTHKIDSAWLFSTMVKMLNSKRQLMI
jgi:hypothetical protein